MNSDRKQLNQGRGAVAGKQHSYNLDVLKPFVRFGIGALGAIARTLIAIVKSIPKPHHDDHAKNDKIVLKR